MDPTPEHNLEPIEPLRGFEKKVKEKVSSYWKTIYASLI